MADKKKQGIRSLLGDMIGDLNDRGKGLGRLFLAPLGISLSRTAEAIKDILADMDIDEFKKKYGVEGTNEVVSSFKISSLYFTVTSIITVEPLLIDNDDSFKVIDKSFNHVSDGHTGRTEIP